MFRQSTTRTVDASCTQEYYRGKPRYSCSRPPESQARRSFLPMNHTERFRLTIRRLASSLVVVLGIASIASAEWREKVLYSFQGGTSDGSTPAGGVVFDQQGNLYGATIGGGPASCKPIGGACGTVFQLSPPTHNGGSWTETLIYQFQGKGSNDASEPSSGLIWDAAGNLYGVTAYGGTGDCVLLGVPAGCGTVYELSPPQTKGGAWTYAVLYSFKSGKDGYLPGGDLVFDTAGNLYGATSFGGGRGTTCDPGYYQGCGTVFELSPPKTKGGKWIEKVLHRFAGGTDGAYPNGGLVLDSNGAIYGTAYAGSNLGCKTTISIGCGMAFELKPPATAGGAWIEKILHRFTGGDDGGGPNRLIFDAKGALYGTAGGGGTTSDGIVLRLTEHAGTWAETAIHRFTGFGNSPCCPSGRLFIDGGGNLYGTAGGGTYFAGVVYRLRAASRQSKPWPFTVLYTFRGAPDGNGPGYSSLIPSRAGGLFSITQGGGTSGDGTVFEVSP